MTGPVLGIDLGTTVSVVASIDDYGEVEVLRNAFGEETTPSAVYFESNGSVVVGDEAKRWVAIDPDNGVILIKRQMGSECPLQMRGQSHTPESISAIILRQLASAATQPGRPRAVITVPAYFGIAEREATAAAGRIAGVEVLELVDEPVAAAIHHGLTSPGDRTVLVYDLGGGTFDTTVLSLSNGKVTVVATDGHDKLGGADVDLRVRDIVLQQLVGLLPTEDYNDLIDDPVKLGNLMLDVEAAKKALSSRTSTSFVVRTATDRMTVTLERTQLEDACADLFDETTRIVSRVLTKALNKGVSVVDEVIMIGGSSRIPALSTRLQSLVGAKPRLVDPDLAVAKGAALRAHQIVHSPKLQVLAQSRGVISVAEAGTVNPVLPKAVGLLVEDSYDPAGERQYIVHLVHANTSLPIRKTTKSYGTILARQSSVRIQIFEQAGSSPSEEVDNNRRVLDGSLTGIGALPAGSVIEITVDLAIDGRLTVIAREPISGQELTLEAFVEGVVDSSETEKLSSTVAALVVRG